MSHGAVVSVGEVWLTCRSKIPSSEHGTLLPKFVRTIDIEQIFKDDKSGGFDLAHTRLWDPQRLDRLLLAVALATLYMHELGEYVLRGGRKRRQHIDAGSRRELSIFQLGLRWLKRYMAYQPDRIPPFRARISTNKIKTIVKPKPLSG